MEKDIISWSANQYETESERTEAFNEFMKEFQDFLKEERTITLEEYKQQVASFWCKAKEILLVDCKENETYAVSNYFREDMVAEYGADIYTSVFKKIENIEELIYRAEDNLEGNFDDNDEYLGDFCYWNISKYRLKKDGEYAEVFSLYQTFLNGYLEIYFNSDMVNEFTSDEKEVYDEWLRLSGIYSKNRVIIKFPFSKGDIVKVSGHPYQNKSQYYICYDDHGNAVSRDYFDRLCTTRLFSRCDVVRYGVFVPCHLEKVKTCEDKALFNIHKMILSADGKEVEKLVNMLRRSFEEDFKAHDNHVQGIEQQFLDMEE